MGSANKSGKAVADGVALLVVLRLPLLSNYSGSDSCFTAAWCSPSPPEVLLWRSDMPRGMALMPLTGTDSQGTDDHHGYCGVWSTGKKFTARLKVDGVTEYVGSHTTAARAAKALDRCSPNLLRH